MSAAAETGVVLSGGGANGAYEVGVLEALIQGRSPATGYRPIDPGVYAGTSVGAFNAAVMASRPGLPAGAAVAELRALWLDRVANSLEHCGNGVYRVRGAPFQLLSPGCLAHPVEALLELGADAANLAAYGLVKGAQFLASDAPLQSRLVSLIDLEAFISESPFKRLLAETIDLDRLRRSAKRLIVAATDWERGRLQLFSKEQIADAVGTDGILASAALPGIFPPVPIDGVPYVDGGVRLNSPLGPVIAAGATTIHLVFLDPHIYNIALTPLPSTADTFYRLTAIIWAANVRQDLLAAAAINALVHRSAAPENRGRPYREVTIHVYRPATALGGGDSVLDFHARRLAGLIELGFQDAASHDCAAAGCVVAGAGAAAAGRWRETAAAENGAR